MLHADICLSDDLHICGSVMPPSSYPFEFYQNSDADLVAIIARDFGFLPKSAAKLQKKYDMYKFFKVYLLNFIKFVR